MTPVRWFAVGGVVLALTVDTILPRALSALSPMLWPTVSTSSPAYWAAAEVKPVADQPISSLPIACAFVPPESDIPTALPLGQEAYTCTRLMMGLTGTEADAHDLAFWLQSDWMSNRSTWVDFYQRISDTAVSLGNRNVLLMKPDGTTAGLASLNSLVQRYRPTTQ